MWLTAWRRGSPTTRGEGGQQGEEGPCLQAPLCRRQRRPHHARACAPHARLHILPAGTTASKPRCWSRTGRGRCATSSWRRCGAGCPRCPAEWPTTPVRLRGARGAGGRERGEGRDRKAGTERQGQEGGCTSRVRTLLPRQRRTPAPLARPAAARRFGRQARRLPVSLSRRGAPGDGQHGGRRRPGGVGQRARRGAAHALAAQGRPVAGRGGDAGRELVWCAAGQRARSRRPNSQCASLSASAPTLLLLLRLLAPTNAGGLPGLRRRPQCIHGRRPAIHQRALLGHAQLLRVCAPDHPGTPGCWLGALFAARARGCIFPALGRISHKRQRLPDQPAPRLLCLQRKHRAGFDALIAGLRYGAVAVNVSSLISFVVTKLTWGAFPGNTPQVREPFLAAAAVARLPCTAAARWPA